MIVSCSSCETKFEIPDGTYRPGRKARCSVCGNVFVLEEQDAAIAQETDFPASQEHSLPENQAATQGVDSPAAQPASPPATSPEPDFMAQMDAALADAESAGTRSVTPPPDMPEPIPAVSASVDDILLPTTPKKTETKRSKRKLFFALGAVFVLALLAYGGIMVYSAFFVAPKATDPDRISDKTVVESLGGRTSSVDTEKEAARQAAVRGLMLENLRQYTVKENESTGPMVVVEGTVVNNSDVSKDLILLEVTLFDKEGNALVLREQYCGVVLSLLQLRTLAKPAIEGALASQYMILSNNTNILPDGRVPFTTVFFDLPDSAYEFEVKLIDAQDSKKEQK